MSDAEAKQRADFDIRWKVALGIEVEDRPFAKSTLQLFRARLILHEKVREVFERSLRFARETGIPQESSDEGGSGHDLHPGVDLVGAVKSDRPGSQTPGPDRSGHTLFSALGSGRCPTALAVQVQYKLHRG